VERGRGEVGTESVDDVLPLVLVYEKERYLPVCRRSQWKVMENADAT